MLKTTEIIQKMMIMIMTVMSKKGFLKKRLFFYGILILLFLNSCNASYYRKEEPLKTGVWQIEDVKEFEVPVNDINSKYNVYIEVENNNQYRTSNLWLYIDSYSPKGKIDTDTVMFLLTDDIGVPYGESSGENVVSRFLYKKEISFAETGKHKILIKHGMREKDLPVVNKISLELTKN